MDRKIKKLSLTTKKFDNAINNEDTEDNELYSVLKEYNKYKKNLVAEKFLNKDVESIDQVNSDLKEKLIPEKSIDNIKLMKIKVQERISECEKKGKIKRKLLSGLKKENSVVNSQKENTTKSSFVDKVIQDALLVGSFKNNLSFSISENETNKFKPMNLSGIVETPIDNKTICNNYDSFNSKVQNKSLSISLSSIKNTENSIIKKEVNKKIPSLNPNEILSCSPKKKQSKFLIPLNKPLKKLKRTNKGEKVGNTNNTFLVNINKLNNSFSNGSNSNNCKITKQNNSILQTQEILIPNGDYYSIGNEGKSMEIIKERIENDIPKENIEKQETKDIYENLLLEDIMEMKNKFFDGEKFSKGKVVEMVYGKKIPKINILYDNDDDHFRLIRDLKILDKSFNHKNYFEEKLKEILENNPQIILKLFEKKEITDDEIKELFVLNRIIIKWDNDLEQLYRDIVNRKTYSNKIKNTFFMFEIRFSKTNKENFKKKHYVDKNSMNQKEIQEFSIIYNKIRTLYKNVFLESNLITNIFIRRDEMIDSLLNNSRKEYLESKLIKFRTLSEEKKNISESINNKLEKEEVELRNYVLMNSLNYNSLNKNKEVSSISRRHHNKILQNLSPHKNKYIDKHNIIYKEQLKKKSIYIKSIITLFKQKLGPKFKYCNLSKNNKDVKLIINYFAEKLQGSIRGLMLRMYIYKMNKKMIVIQKSFRKYISLKNFIIQIIKNFDTTLNYKPFKLLVRILYWNYSMSYKYNFKGEYETLIIDFFRKYLGKNMKNLPLRVSANTLINAIEHVILEQTYNRNNKSFL